MLKMIASLQRATLAARERTKRNLAVPAEQGYYQVAEVVYDHKGKSSINPLTQWGSMQQAIDFLNAME